MKRVTVMLDDEVLEAAVRAIGVKSYSEAVNVALNEVVRRHKVQSMGRFVRRGLWAGNLAEMREDRAPHKVRGRKAMRP